MTGDFPLIVILGPTACGKTKLAVRVATSLDGEIISADSRQVYRGMDIGTGKDLADYDISGNRIPCHLIDIVDPGYEYNLFEYQQDFYRAYQEIRSRNSISVLCGGTGLYLEAVLSGYKLPPIQADAELERTLSSTSTGELVDLLKRLRIPHNTTDTLDRDRLITSIRIGLSQETSPSGLYPPLVQHSKVFGIFMERLALRARITDRLHQRLQQGMIDEVEALLRSGLTPEKVKFYGLEYRFITGYLCGEYSYQEMEMSLNRAIHQFAKRQMTWFRRMERRGIPITWMDSSQSVSDMANKIISTLHPKR